jgi:hypothetical protein
MMKRVIWHWTAGGHTPNSTDLNAYHEIIDGQGRVHSGTRPISANKAPIQPNYARHTANLNSDSIGISMAAMVGAVERPFNAGRFPVTQAQVDALVRRTAELCAEYNIPITRETVLSHAEVPITLGVAQPGKWDITWIPGMTRPGNAVEVGDLLRAKVSQLTAQRPPIQQIQEQPVASSGDNWIASLIKWIINLATGKTK